uniref:Uncharacterized protein n=1 Tax=Rhizophora mucronata TaxID=61149 RepID=A0A2P2MU12_RHIMU
MYHTHYLHHPLENGAIRYRENNFTK